MYERYINKNLTIEKVFDRFINSIETAKSYRKSLLDSNIVPIEELKKFHNERIVDYKDYHICIGLFDIVAKKINIASLLFEFKEDRLFRFEIDDMYHLVKDAIEICKKEYEMEGKSFSELKYFEVVDVITTKAAGIFIEKSLMQFINIPEDENTKSEEI